MLKRKTYTYFLLFMGLFFSLGNSALAVDKYQKDILFPRLQFETTVGNFTVELNRPKAPLTVAHFIKLVVDGEYNNTIFHRVIKGFVAQAGGYNNKYEAFTDGKKIINESGNGYKNSEGTIAMARMTDPHSATRQFFFNLTDNKSLDPGKNWGYTVFGEIDSNFEVLEKFAEIKTDFNTSLNQPDVPVDLVIIKRITLLAP